MPRVWEMELGIIHNSSNRVAGKTKIVRLHQPCHYMTNRYDMHIYDEQSTQRSEGQASKSHEGLDH